MHVSSPPFLLVCCPHTPLRCCTGSSSSRRSSRSKVAVAEGIAVGVVVGVGVGGRWLDWAISIFERVGSDGIFKFAINISRCRNLSINRTTIRMHEDTNDRYRTLNARGLWQFRSTPDFGHWTNFGGHWVCSDTKTYGCRNASASESDSKSAAKLRIAPSSAPWQKPIPNAAEYNYVLDIKNRMRRMRTD